MLETLRLATVDFMSNPGFTPRMLVLDHDLFMAMQKPYDATSNPMTVYEMLVSREWFEEIVWVRNFTTLSGKKGAMILDNAPENMGFIDVAPVTIDPKVIQEGRSDVYNIEEKISEVIMFQPLAACRLDTISAS
jgi:hypothetical protein